MRTHLNFDGKPIACGSIDDLPGCSQIAVFHSAFVLPEYRQSGHAKKAHYERLFKAKELLYDAAICTVDMNNLPQVHILADYGWKPVLQFVSSKTGHRVGLFGTYLR